MKRIGAVLGIALLVAIPVMAWGGGGTTTLNSTTNVGGSPTETPSDNWQLIQSVSVEDVIGGSLAISVSGDAYAMDYGSDGGFKGEKYAALKMKAEFNDNSLQVRTFADNRGVVGSSKPRVLTNTAKWGTGAGGDGVVNIYIKSLNKFDRVGLKDYIVQLTYGRT